MRTIHITAAAIILCSAISVMAQAGGWDRVESLKHRTHLIVETRDGSTHKARFSRAGQNDLVIRTGGSEISIPKDNIYRIYIARKGSVIRRALWGAAAGAGIGIGVGAVAAAATNDPLAGAAGVIYGVPAGAAIGAITTGRKRGELIYQSP